MEADVMIFAQTIESRGLKHNRLNQICPKYSRENQAKVSQSEGDQTKPDQYRPAHSTSDQLAPMHRQWPYSELRLCSHCAALL